MTGRRVQAGVSRTKRVAPLRLFVTATDTGVGKTETSCALLSLLADAGRAPVPFKPYESGCKDPDHPQDAMALLNAARTDVLLEQVSLHRFRAPLAPGIAAKRLRQEPSFARTLAAFKSFKGRTLVVEGAGGLFVPVDSRRDVINLIRGFELPALLVSRAGLGTLNHTALSLEALRRRRIPVLGVVLVQAQPTTDPSMKDNAAYLARRHGVRVVGPIPYVADPRRRRARFRRFLQPLLEELESAR